MQLDTSFGGDVAIDNKKSRTLPVSSVESGALLDDRPRPLIENSDEPSGRFSTDFGAGVTGYPLMRRSSPSGGGVGVERLILLVDRGTGFASVFSVVRGRSHFTTHFVLVLVRGGMSGELVISGEGGLLDGASVPAVGEPVGDFGNGGGIGSIFGRSQLRLMDVSCLVSSGGSGDSEGILTTRAERSSLVMI